jgi:hypothetical protein
VSGHPAEDFPHLSRPCLLAAPVLLGNDAPGATPSAGLCMLTKARGRHPSSAIPELPSSSKPATGVAEQAKVRIVSTTGSQKSFLAVYTPSLIHCRSAVAATTNTSKGCL